MGGRRRVAGAPVLLRAAAVSAAAAPLLTARAALADTYQYQYGSPASSTGDNGFLPVFFVLVVGGVAVGWLVKLARAMGDDGGATGIDYEPGRIRRYESNDNDGWRDDPSGYQPQRQSSSLSGMEAIMASDPAFVRQAFLDGAGAVFLAVQQAWLARDVDQARPYLSQGMQDSLRQRIDAAVASGLANQVEDLQVKAVQVAEATHDPSFDSITVRVDASDVEPAPEVGGQGGGKREITFSERWTFTRPAGHRTLEDSGEIGKCPNCGAPLSVGIDGACKFCGVKAGAGGFGWVVARVEQGWEPPSSRRLTSDELAARMSGTSDEPPAQPEAG